jgi:hypothetical protein
VNFCAPSRAKRINTYQSEKRFEQKLQRKQNTHFVSQILFPRVLRQLNKEDLYAVLSDKKLGRTIPELVRVAYVYLAFSIHTTQCPVALSISQPKQVTRGALEHPLLCRSNLFSLGFKALTAVTPCS